MLQFLVDALSFQLVLALDLKGHLELEFGLLLVDLELTQFELSALLEIMLDLLKLRLELDGLPLHLVLSAIKVSNTPSILILNLVSVSRDLLCLLLFVLVGFHLPFIPGILTLDPPLPVCFDPDFLLIKKLLEDWVCSRGSHLLHQHLEMLCLL